MRSTDFSYLKASTVPICHGHLFPLLHFDYLSCVFPKYHRLELNRSPLLFGDKCFSWSHLHSFKYPKSLLIMLKMHFWNSLPLSVRSHSKMLAVFFTICTLLLFWINIVHDALLAVSFPSLPAISIYKIHEKSKSLELIRNKTLGVC